jgi:hypothetical protein
MSDDYVPEHSLLTSQLHQNGYGQRARLKLNGQLQDNRRLRLYQSRHDYDDNTFSKHMAYRARCIVRAAVASRRRA